MKKIMNEPKEFVNETIEGILLAYPKMYTTADNELRAFIKRDIPEGKVAIVTGGGSGHLPLFLGYVGDGLADGCAVGNVFASPSAKVMFEVTKAVNRGAGVLYLFGNYGGDRMNFEMCSEMAEDEDIETTIVKGNDDVASAPMGEEMRRRGVAGIFFAYKVAGAAADRMLPLSKVTEIAQRAVDSTRSMGIALSSCILPEVGKPSFEIGESEMEFGMGIHGEPGIMRSDIMSADKSTEIIMERILDDIDIQANQNVAVLINGLGATSREELFITNRKVHAILREKSISVFRTYVGEVATSMEMAGLSVSIMKLDDELKGLLDAPAYSPLLSMYK